MSDYTSVGDGLRIVCLAVARLELQVAVRSAIDAVTHSTWNSWNAAPRASTEATAHTATEDASAVLQHIPECEQHPDRCEGATSWQQQQQMSKIASWEEAPGSLYPGAAELRGPAQRLGAGVLQAAWYAASGPDNSMPLPIQFESNLTKDMWRTLGKRRDPPLYPSRLNN